MWVKAAPGLQCPKEENPREYITDGAAVEVDPTSYYQRLVDDGSLVETTKPEAQKSGREALGGKAGAGENP